MAVLGTAVAALGLDAFLIHRWRKEIARARRVNAAELAEQERRQSLDTSGVTFSAKAWIPYGAPDEPEDAPLSLEVHGATAWVHEVRLSFGSRERGPRSAVADMHCKPWNGRIPTRLRPGHDLKLDWPVPRMVEPEPISWELDVVWSVEPGGPTSTALVPGGETEWRYAGAKASA
jgi:hypothetical protein